MQMHLYRANITVFGVRLKSSKLLDRQRNSVGREFPTVGPATEKVRSNEGVD